MNKTLLTLFVLVSVVFLSASATPAQKKTRSRKSSSAAKKPPTELEKLREAFITATREYKAQLEKLRTSYEKSVVRAEEKLVQTNQLFELGLVSKKDVETAARAVADAKDKVAEVNQRSLLADNQVAAILLEAEAEAKFRARPLRKGGFLTTNAMIRYNGGATWLLSDAWRIQRFFQDSVKKPLPIAVFGQGAIHDRWRLDHRNAIDVSLHPDGVEGQLLLNYLRSQGIPFLAFRQAIPGTATGPHIHIGRPSHRY